MQTYFLFVIIPMILGLWAQSRIRSAYSKYSAVPTQYNMSGAQAARKMLDQAGLQYYSSILSGGNRRRRY